VVELTACSNRAVVVEVQARVDSSQPIPTMLAATLVAKGSRDVPDDLLAFKMVEADVVASDGAPTAALSGRVVLTRWTSRDDPPLGTLPLSWPATGEPLSVRVGFAFDAPHDQFEGWEAQLWVRVDPDDPQRLQALLPALIFHRYVFPDGSTAVANELADGQFTVDAACAA
jgi:hypothetical protein